MLTRLFGSRVRSKLLTAFFTSPGDRFNAWELAQSLHENYSAVWRELGSLQAAGILNKEANGRTWDFSVNPACAIAPELRSLILKTSGISDALRARLIKEKEVEAAFIYGSYASGEADAASDLDLMVIGELDLERFSGQIADLEKELGRSINYVIFTRQEWQERLARRDAFATNVANSPQILLIGK